jgi:hypothetical protein
MPCSPLFKLPQQPLQYRPQPPLQPSFPNLKEKERKLPLWQVVVEQSLVAVEEAEEVVLLEAVEEVKAHQAVPVEEEAAAVEKEAVVVEEGQLPFNKAKDLLKSPLLEEGWWEFFQNPLMEIDRDRNISWRSSKITED